MSATRVLVVEHQGNAGLGLFGERLAGSGVELVVVGPDTGSPVPESLDGIDALLVLGGAMGPDDDDRAPWLPATRRLLSSGVERGIPTLGICLGAQLLATATGGHVRSMPQGPEVGLCAVRFEADAATDPLFGGVADLGDDGVPVVQWHWLEADELPGSASVLASSGACGNQVFRIGDRAWGVQFHPEALGATAADWAVEDRQGLVELGLEEDSVVGEVRAAEARLREIWGGLADRFAALAREGARETTDAGRRLRDQSRA